MRYRLPVLAAGGILAAVSASVWLGDGPVVQAQTGARRATAAAVWTAPRTPWGDPDLEGIWRPAEISTPMERPVQFGTREFLTDEELAVLEKTGQAESEEEGRADPRFADHRPRNAAETATARPHEKALLGQEYNAWWQAGTQRKRSVWNRTSLIIDPPDGRLPALTPEALNRLEAREEARVGRGEADGPEDRNLGERCLTVLFRPGGRSGLSGVKQIVQAPGYVVMVYDGFTFPRIIPLDERPRLDNRIRQWLGDSRGRWEGDTLVVEVTNVNDKQDGGPIAASHNEYLPGIHQHQYFGSGTTGRVIERYTRVSPDRIEYQYTLNDPSVFMKPYTTLTPLEKANDYLMLENACHEGNYGMTNLLRGGRANEKSAVIAAEAETETRRQQMEELKKKTAEALKAAGR